MRVTTEITWDIATGEVLEHESFDYQGPVAECKGGAAKQEQQNADAQRNMENQLAQQQLNMQQTQLNAVNKVADPMIAAGGMSPEQHAALTSIFLNDIPNQFRGVAGNINQQLTARGISGGQYGTGSGDIARQFATLGAAEAGQQQQGLANVQLAKQQQLMQLLGLKLGIGSQYGSNIGTFNAGAGQALNVLRPITTTRRRLRG